MLLGKAAPQAQGSLVNSVAWVVVQSSHLVALFLMSQQPWAGLAPSHAADAPKSS